MSVEVLMSSLPEPVRRSDSGDSDNTPLRGSNPAADSSHWTLTSQDETWSPRGIRGALTAESVKKVLRESVVPSYPNVNAAFQRANVFGESTIRKGAFREALCRWGFNMNDSEYESLWADMPKDAEGRIGPTELRQFMRGLPVDVTGPTNGGMPPQGGGETSDVEQPTLTVTSDISGRVLKQCGSFVKAAERLYPDEHGDVSISQLKIFLKTCGAIPSEYELKELIAALDKHGTGNVNVAALFAKLEASSSPVSAARPIRAINSASSKATSARTVSTASSHRTSDAVADTDMYTVAVTKSPGHHSVIDEGGSVYSDETASESEESDEDAVNDVTELNISKYDSRNLDAILDKDLAAQGSPGRHLRSRNVDGASSPLRVNITAPPVVAVTEPSSTTASGNSKFARKGSKFRARPPATFVSPTEFRRSLAGIGIPFTQGSTEDDSLWYAFMRRFDTADDGKINLSEFWAVVADVMSPGVCHRMNLNFMTVPSAGHPKARWHSMIEPTLNRAVNGFLHRLEAAFRVLDKSNSGFISKSASPACISASGSNLGPDMDVFFDDDVGNVMLAFDELKTLVVSFFLQHYPPSPPDEVSSSGFPSSDPCTPEIVVKLVSNWNAFRRVLRAYDVDGVGVISRTELTGLLASFGVDTVSASRLVQSFAQVDLATPLLPAAGAAPNTMVSYLQLCDYIVARSDALFSRRPTTAGNSRRPSAAPGSKSATSVPGKSTSPQKLTPGALMSSGDTFFSGIVIPAEISEVYSAVFGLGMKKTRLPRRKLTPADLHSLLPASAYDEPVAESTVDTPITPVAPLTNIGQSRALSLSLPPVLSPASAELPSNPIRTSAGPASAPAGTDDRLFTAAAGAPTVSDGSKTLPAAKSATFHGKPPTTPAKPTAPAPISKPASTHRKLTGSSPLAGTKKP